MARVTTTNRLMTAKFEDRGVFERLFRDAERFAADAEAAAQEAAEEAQKVTRREWRTGRARPTVDPRPGRPTTRGKLDSYLYWNPEVNGARFDVSTIDSVAPYWIIHEVGTGRRAQMTIDAESGVSVPVNIKRQSGRQISRGLVWATSSGRYVPPMAGVRQHQIYRYSDVNFPRDRRRNRGLVRGYAPPIRIRNEIRGRHMVREGAKAGRDLYRKRLMDSARKAFKKRRR